MRIGDMVQVAATASSNSGRIGELLTIEWQNTSGTAWRVGFGTSDWDAKLTSSGVYLEKELILQEPDMKIKRLSAYTPKELALYLQKSPHNHPMILADHEGFTVFSQIGQVSYKANQLDQAFAAYRNHLEEINYFPKKAPLTPKEILKEISRIFGNGLTTTDLNTEETKVVNLLVAADYLRIDGDGEIEDCHGVEHEA